MGSEGPYYICMNYPLLKYRHVEKGRKGGVTNIQTMAIEVALAAAKIGEEGEV